MLDNLNSSFSYFLQSIPKLEPLSEQKLSCYRQYGISGKEARLIEKTILFSSKFWVSQEMAGGYVTSCPTIPRSLFYYKTGQCGSGVETLILLNDREVGRGKFMRYIQALESSSLKTYVFGLIMIRGRVHEGRLRGPKHFSRMAAQLVNAFRLVGSHPSIVELRVALPFYQRVGEHKFPFYGFVFEYCEQGNLENYAAKGPALTGKEIKRILTDVASALKHMHSLGMAHYDVKEENILLTRNENGELRAKLGDLGFANSARCFTGCGTPVYLPPEYWMGFPHKREEDLKAYDGRRFDMWAFGIVMKWLVEKDHFIPDAVVSRIERMKIEVISHEQAQKERDEKKAEVSLMVEKMRRKLQGEKAKLPPIPSKPVPIERLSGVQKARRDPQIAEERLLALRNLYLDESFYPQMVSSENDTVYKVYCQILQFDPKSRPASMDEVLSRLEAIYVRAGENLAGK